MATTNPWYSLGTGQYANPFKAAAQPIAPGFASVMSSKPEVDSFAYSKPVFSKEVQAFIDKNKGDLKWVADDPVAKFLDKAHLSQLYGFNGGAGESARRKLLEGGVSADAAKKYADQVARYYNVVGVTDPKKRGAEYQVAGQLYDQLLSQAKGNGFDWGDVKTAGNDAYRVSERLGELGVTSLSDLKWKGDKLYNSKTGKQIDLDKGNRLTYAAGGGGDGFVNYRVGADKNGNPVLYPQWEESSDKGKIAAIASIAANFIPGVGPLAAAGIQAGIAAAGGAGLKGALLAGAGSLAGNVLAPGISNAVGVSPTGAAAGAIKGAVKGAISGGVNAGGKGALAGAVVGAAGGAAGAGASGAASGLSGGNKLVTALAGGLGGTAGKTLAGQVVSQAVGGQPARPTSGTRPDTTAHGAQVSQKAPGTQGSTSAKDDARMDGGNSMANQLQTWLQGFAGGVNPAQLAFQNYLMQGAERDRDSAQKKAEEYANLLKGQVTRVTGLADKLNGTVNSELTNGDKDADAVLKKLLGGDTGASAITDLKKLAATREARNTADYNKLTGTIDDAGNRMDALYKSLGTAKMYGENDVNALAEDIYNKKSEAVDRALRIASGQGFADSLGRGLSDSSQAADTRDSVTRRFADTYAGLEADSRTQATNQVGQLATMQSQQRGARISELTNALNPELSARVSTYRPDNSALDAAKAEATFDQGNLQREQALWTAMTSGQNQRLSTLLGALGGANTTAVNAAGGLNNAASANYAAALEALGGARNGVFGAIAPGVNNLFGGGAGATAPGGGVNLGGAANWLTGLFKGSGGGDGADIPDGLDIDGDGALTQTDITGWGTTGGTDASDWGFDGDWGDWWGTTGSADDWGNWGDTWGLGGDVAWN